MGHIEHKHHAPSSLTCAVITISDSRTEADDESGQHIIKALRENGHNVSSYALLKNDSVAINNKLDELLADPGLQFIITTGGTGLGIRDLTVETVAPLLDKKLEGFGELFRHLSYREIGSAAIMSRALAGVIKGKLIVCLPGSKAAVKLALKEIIMPEMGHMVREATR
jgi:molybdenum cofactor biosynthesis protein B